MRNASLAVLREIGVDTGGSNVQFSINPKDGRMIVIEMNPRVSRSSALASKATGFPIAKVAAKLAVGYTLDELRNEITGGATPGERSSPASTTWSPRSRASRSRNSRRPTQRLTTQMKSVGEVMAMGRTFQESFQKALRGLEVGVDGLEREDAGPRSAREGTGRARPRPHLVRGRRLRAGPDAWTKCIALTKIDPWFLVQIEEIVKIELELETKSLDDIDKRHPARAEAEGLLRPPPGAPAQDHRHRGAREAPRAGRAPGLQARRHLRRRVRDQHRLHVLDLRGRVRSRARPTRRRSWCWAAAPTASARASSSTTAACMRRWRCARTATRPSWSTAIPRPCRPTTTPPTACTSSR